MYVYSVICFTTLAASIALGFLMVQIGGISFGLHIKARRLTFFSWTAFAYLLIGLWLLAGFPSLIDGILGLLYEWGMADSLPPERLFPTLCSVFFAAIWTIYCCCRSAVPASKLSSTSLLLSYLLVALNVSIFLCRGMVENRVELKKLVEKMEMMYVPASDMQLLKWRVEKLEGRFEEDEPSSVSR